jgi:hypothetical protein
MSNLQLGVARTATDAELAFLGRGWFASIALAQTRFPTPSIFVRRATASRSRVFRGEQMSLTILGM